MVEPDDQPRDRDPRVTLSRALLEQIIEQAAEAITVADRDGRLIVVNEAARRAAQRRVERPTLDSIRTDWGAFYENGRQIARGEYALQRALHGQSVKDREVELVRDDGTSVDLSISAQPVREADGTIIAAVATFMDITARKRAEAAFRESERRTRAIFDTAYQFEGLLDRRGTLLDANATALGFIGAKLADVVGRPFWETPWWHDLPKSQAQLKAAVAEAAAGRFVRCEMEHRSAAGGVHLFDFSLKPIRDETGQVVLLVPEGRDITERHQIETRLRESEARYRAVFKQAAVGMARVSLAGEFLEVNDRFCAITGYTRQELLAGGFQQITHPDDLAPNLVKSRALLAGGVDDFTMEKRYITKHGAAIWATLSVGLVRDEAGRPAYFVSVIEDITARKEAEAALRASEARYRALTDLSPDAIFVHVGERIVYANRAASALLDVSAPDEIIGRSPLDFVDPAYRDAVRARNARLLEEGGVNPLFVQVFRKTDGSAVDVEVTTAAITWLGQPAIQALVRDVSERRRAADALRASEARYAMLARLSPVGIFHADAEGQCTYANERWCEIAGCGADAAKSGHWAAFIHPDDRARVVAEWKAAIARERPFKTEYRYRHADGSVTWVLGQATEEYDAAGRLIGFVCTDTDITERKEAEEANALLMRELNHRVKNVIATVGSIARLTLRFGTDTKTAFDAFQRRLRALANTHTLLNKSGWAGASLGDVLSAELSPYGKGRFAIEGPAVTLSPHAATTFSLIVHELATNAAKYGALSAPAGRISVRWTLTTGTAPSVHLTWHESGGPPAAAPGRMGFGTFLITQSLEHGMRGKADLSFGPDGLVATLLVPLSAVQASA